MKRNGVKIIRYWYEGLTTVMYQYQILQNNKVIKTGIEVLDDSIDFETFRTESQKIAVLENEIMDEWNYINSKPNINDFSNIMQDCVKDTLVSEDGLGSISKKDYLEKYTDEEKSNFLKEIKQYCLDQYVDFKDNLRNGNKNSSIITSYGFLPTCFDLTGANYC